jgi:hypothetical protein
MKRAIFVLAGAVALCANSHADPVLHTTTFAEDIFIETDTFETSSGSVLFTTNGVGYTDWLSPIIAADLAGDPAVPAQIQSTVSLVTLASEYQFLTEKGPQYIVFGGVGPAIVDPSTGQNITVDEDFYRAMETAGGPGYSIVDVIPEHIVNVTYETGAIEPDGSIIDGTVTFFVAEESIVERPVVATPEPSMLAFACSGLLLILFARRKTFR